jgi:hypothetical protein
MAYVRLTTLLDSRNFALRKYDRAYELSVFDGFYLYERFASLSCKDFPLREVPKAKRNNRRIIINPNDDSNSEFDDDFFGLETPPDECDEPLE